MNDFEKNMYQEIRMLREKFSILKLENDKLKEQLRWRLVSDPPKEDGDYLCRWEGSGRFLALYKNMAWYIWDDALEEHVKLVHLPYMWLPIP